MPEPSVGALPVNLYVAGRQAMLEFDLDGYARAAPLFLLALESRPEDALVHGALAETYAFWGSRREKNGQECLSYYGLCFEEARKALELGPGVGQTHRAMAVALRAGVMEDAEAAIREAARACELSPYDGENCWELWRATGCDPQNPLIQKALDLFPNLCGARIDLGVALCERDRLDEAELHLLKALEINPRNSLALYDFAMVKLRKAMVGEAGQILSRALEFCPEDPLLLSGLELAKAEKGEPAAAA
ncbi:MAG TPA: hypothetical protein VNK24_05480 [Elusimicrobiota bacterium]|nr:hypothetical protein [Elusimicrobiota bacterium]